MVDYDFMLVFGFCLTLSVLVFWERRREIIFYIKAYMSGDTWFEKTKRIWRLFKWKG